MNISYPTKQKIVYAKAMAKNTSRKGRQVIDGNNLGLGSCAKKKHPSGCFFLGLAIGWLLGSGADETQEFGARGHLAAEGSLHVGGDHF